MIRAINARDAVEFLRENGLSPIDWQIENVN